jgi:1,4-dihydroxy-2-naphthoyl-CoA hydrolase
MERIFSKDLKLEELNALTKGNMGEMLGIEFLEIGPDFLKASMPVRASSKQPYGLLHGGASVALAETVASVAANYSLDPKEELYAVGLEINANHIKSMTSGLVVATCRPLQLGRKISVWDIRITNEAGTLVCISRMTAAILERKKNKAG